MSEKENKFDKNGACPCKVCKRKYSQEFYPTYTIIDDLVYARCPNCDRYSPYEFLGSTKKGAIQAWNDCMMHRDY